MSTIAVVLFVAATILLVVAFVLLSGAAPRMLARHRHERLARAESLRSERDVVIGEDAPAERRFARPSETPERDAVSAPRSRAG